jgi:hypothetical protein
MKYRQAFSGIAVAAKHCFGLAAGDKTSQDLTSVPQIAAALRFLGSRTVATLDGYWHRTLRRADG